MVIELTVFSHNKAIIQYIAIATFWRATNANIYWSFNRQKVYARWCTVQLFNIKKSCEVSRLPDHDILIDYGLIDLSKVPTAILQGVQKHWGERAVTNGAHTIY